MSWPNHDPKPVGTFVRHVHPLGRYDDRGVVIQGDSGYGSITVATGTGGTCYGPAEHWEPTDRAPEWLARASTDFLVTLEKQRARLAVAV